jgi:hypothetical protein
LAATCLAVAACSSGDDGGDAGAPDGGDTTPATASAEVQTTTPLQADEIPAAVAALEQRLGGPQEYTEINAIPEGVNLFVAIEEGQEAPWFYRSEGGLEPPPAFSDAAGEPFSVEGVDLALADDLVLQVQRQFPGAVVTSVALLDVPDQGLVWALRSQSPRGGVLQVTFSTDGRVLSATPSG